MGYRSRVGDRSPLPSLKSEISILNAEKYGEESIYQTLKLAAERRGSVVIDEIAAAGKRSSSLYRFEEGGDEEEDAMQKKRSRGRPRLDTKDETAADRRRTQIRLAQRAYRHRKDTAITTLEQRVKELETANESMSREFSKFYDIILAEGMLDMVPHATPRLKIIADKLLRIASMAGTSATTMLSESDEPTNPAPSGRRATGNDTSDVAVKSGLVKAGSQTSVAGEAEVTTITSYSSSLPSIRQPSNSFAFEVIAQATPNNASFPFFTSMESSPAQQQSPYDQSTAVTSPYTKLSPLTLHAFHERTFSRRLQRITLERGLKLVSMNNPPADRYAVVFGLCLLFESRESIARKLSAILRKIQNESLDQWKAPLGAMGNDQPVFLDTTNFRSAGPDNLNQALLPLGKSANTAGFSTMQPFGLQAPMSSDDKIEQRMRAIFQNFEGEFYTSDEVELFLRRLGINIPQHAEYVEAELDLNDLGSIDETDLTVPSATVQGPYGVGVTSNNHTALNGAMGSVWPLNISSSLDNFGNHSLRSSSSDGSSMNMAGFSEASDPNDELAAFMNTNDFSHMWPPERSWSKAKVTVDVHRLIEEMVTSSVCLGRTPGIRPRDIVKAVKIASGLVSAGA